MKSKKKVTAQEIFLLVLVLGIIVVGYVYLMIYSDYKDRTEIVKAECATLAEEVESMREYFENMPTYIKETNDMIAEMNEMVADFPSDCREEEGIMMGVEMQANAIIKYDTIGLGGNNVIHTVPQEVIDKAAVESFPKQLQFRERAVTYKNITTYENLRDCVKVIYDNPNRIGLNSIVYKSEREVIGEDENAEDGLKQRVVLNGSISVSFYNLTGTDKPYVAPTIPDYINGTADIFGYIPETEEEAEE